MKRRCLPVLAIVLLAAMAVFAQQSQPAQEDPPTQSGVSGLPLNFEPHTGDLDEMVKRGSIRALVLYSRSGFFYVDGKPEGIYYEALRVFEQFINQKPSRVSRLRAYVQLGGNLVLVFSFEHGFVQHLLFIRKALCQLVQRDLDGLVQRVPLCEHLLHWVKFDACVYYSPQSNGSPENCRSCLVRKKSAA